MGITQSITKQITSVSEYVHYIVAGYFCYSAHITDVGYSKHFLDGLRSVKKEGIAAALLKCAYLDALIERITLFIESNIDIEKLKKSGHAKSWDSHLEVPEDREERLAVIREIVTKTLQVSSKDKDDKTLADYIYRLLGNILESQLGGFMVSSDLPSGAPTPMQFLKEHKQTFLEHYLRNTTHGLTFCPEHDQEIVTDIPGTLGIRLNPEVHHGNMSKVLYFREDLKIRELCKEEIQVQMVKSGKSIVSYDDNEDRFSLIEVEGPKGSLFEHKTIVFLYHLKSVGSRKDFESDKFKNIYRFTKDLQDSFKGERRICMGDYNAPEFDEGTAHFGLKAEHLHDYPIRYGGDESDSHLLYGFTNVTTYPQSHISTKERMADMKRNAQAPRGKHGKRTYYTERVVVDIPEEVNFTSQLFPQPQVGERLVTPHCAGSITDGVFAPDMEKSWLSDHQALETVVNGMPLKVFNTLSDECSTSQPFKAGLTADEIAVADEEYTLIFRDLINMIMAAHKSK